MRHQVSDGQPLHLPPALRVLFLTLAYFPDTTGGAERQARLQAEALVRRGHSVTVVCPRQRGQPAVTALEGVEVRRVGIPALPASRIWYTLALLAWMLLNAGRFDIVHVHALRLSSNMAAWGAVLMRRPVYVKIAAAGEQGEAAYWTHGWRRRLSVLPRCEPRAGPDGRNRRAAYGRRRAT